MGILLGASIIYRSLRFSPAVTTRLMRYRLRTLLIVMAIGPMVLATPWLAWEYYREYRTVRAINAFFRVPPRPQLQPTTYHYIGPSEHSPFRKPSPSENRK